jgi:hypothetical protein
MPTSSKPHCPAAASDEALLHVSAELTAFHIRLPPGIQYPPHDHGMVALLGLYRGSETNLVYRRAGTSLIETGRIEYQAPTVAALPRRHHPRGEQLRRRAVSGDPPLSRQPDRSEAQPVAPRSHRRAALRAEKV